jgi:hypothetical protein
MVGSYYHQPRRVDPPADDGGQLPPSSAPTGDEGRVPLAMDTQHFELLAKLTPTLRDTGGDFGVRAGQLALRSEALRQLRGQLREWQRVPAMHTTGTPCLVVASERAKLHDSLDLLRTAGEDVPSWLYQRGSLVRTTNAAGGIAAGVSLVSLLADITRVLAWFDAAPRPLGAGLASGRAGLGADADGTGDDAGARERA